MTSRFDKLFGIFDEIDRLNAEHAEQIRLLKDSANEEVIVILSGVDEDMRRTASILYWWGIKKIGLSTMVKQTWRELRGEVFKPLAVGAISVCKECGNEYAENTYSITDYQHGHRFYCTECKTKHDEDYNRRRMLEEKRLEKLRTMPYKEYLITPEWIVTRKNALKRAKYRCQLCHTGGVLNVHHRTYERRGNEQPSDLVVLCASCHKKFHNLVGKGAGDEKENMDQDQAWTT